MESAVPNSITDRAMVLTFFIFFKDMPYGAESEAWSEERGGNQEQKVKGRGRGARATSGEKVHVVGFTGTGYQRSLPLNESDAYNF